MLSLHRAAQTHPKHTSCCLLRESECVTSATCVLAFHTLSLYRNIAAPKLPPKHATRRASTSDAPHPTCTSAALCRYVHGLQHDVLARTGHTRINRVGLTNRPQNLMRQRTLATNMTDMSFSSGASFLFV